MSIPWRWTKHDVKERKSFFLHQQSDFKRVRPEISKYDFCAHRLADWNIVNEAISRFVENIVSFRSTAVFLWYPWKYCSYYLYFSLSLSDKVSLCIQCQIMPVVMSNQIRRVSFSLFAGLQCYECGQGAGGGTCSNSSDWGQLVTCQEGQTSCFKSESSEWATVCDPHNKTKYLGSVFLMKYAHRIFL